MRYAAAGARRPRESMGSHASGPAAKKARKDRSGANETARILVAMRRLVRFLRLENGSRNGKLSTAQLFVLVQLGREPQLSIRDLAERTMTDPSSVSVVVSKLCDQSLIRRDQDPQDKRRALLSLTPAGKRLVARVPDLPQVRIADGLARLAGPQRKQVAEALELLVSAIGADELAPRMFLAGGGEGG